jgi:hypothetical protein
MVKTPANRRLAAAIVLLAALFFVITVLQIFVADPLGWIGISGALVLLLVSLYRLEDDLLALAREAAESGAEDLAMGCGDGSLGLVAAVAMDMNLDRNDPVAALAAFQGEERLIDVATIGWPGEIAIDARF